MALSIHSESVSRKKKMHLNSRKIRNIWICVGATFIIACNLSGITFDTSRSDQEGFGNSEITAGLKEALSIGTQKAADLVSQENGYFGHELIKILMPEEMKKVTDALAAIGFQKQVDEFVLSMNRAAEKAAPAAVAIFVDAIKAMSMQDAANILSGEETAATEYFKENTSENLYTAFKPIISATMEEVGVTQTYKQLMDKYSSLPFVSEIAVDLDEYVTHKSLDGLFFMVGEEEKKIRKDPMARVTDLLKKVFK